MIDCDVNMMLYSNFVMDQPKIRPFSVLVWIFNPIELKFGKGPFSDADSKFYS